MKKGKLGAFLAILDNSPVALLTPLDFENNYDYSTQATTTPFSQRIMGTLLNSLTFAVVALIYFCLREK